MFFFSADIPKEHRSKLDSIFTAIVADQASVKGNIDKVGVLFYTGITLVIGGMTIVAYLIWKT
jgi:hypothetical protein